MLTASEASTSPEQRAAKKRGWGILTMQETTSFLLKIFHGSATENASLLALIRHFLTEQPRGNDTLQFFIL